MSRRGGFVTRIGRWREKAKTNNQYNTKTQSLYNSKSRNHPKGRREFGIFIVWVSCLCIWAVGLPHRDAETTRLLHATQSGSVVPKHYTFLARLGKCGRVGDRVGARGDPRGTLAHQLCFLPATVLSFRSLLSPASLSPFQIGTRGLRAAHSGLTTRRTATSNFTEGLEQGGVSSSRIASIPDFVHHSTASAETSRTE